MNRDIGVDARGFVLGALGQEFVKLDGEDVGPKGARDGDTYGCADGAEETEERENHGDFLVVHGSHEGQLASERPHARVDTVEKLTHDEVASRRVGSTEMDEKRGSKDGERNDGNREPLGTTPVAKDAEEKISIPNVQVGKVRDERTGQRRDR